MVFFLIWREFSSCFVWLRIHIAGVYVCLFWLWFWMWRGLQNRGGMEEEVTSFFLIFFLLFSFCPRAGFALLSFFVSGGWLLEVPLFICLGVKTRPAVGKSEPRLRETV